ncbi:MAG TPA: tetratricopeptide repeat protein [Desulfotomaculum sp.]|nr:tetratricopeptide repeat protein [Desulfotomaculum sp.]
MGRKSHFPARLPVRPASGKGGIYINDPLSILKDLEEKYVTFYRQGRYADAEAVAERALDIARQTLGPGHLYTITFQNNIACLNRIRQDKAGTAIQPAERSTGKATLSLWLAAVLLVLTLIIPVTWSVFPFFSQSGPVSAAPALNPGEGDALPFYRVRAVFYPREKTIAGEEEVTFECAGPKNEILFNLYFNRYRDVGLDSSEIRQYAFQRGKDRGCISIQRVLHNGTPVPFKAEGEVLQILPPEGVFPPGKQNITIDFELKIPYIADRSGGNERGIWLGNWLPTLNVDGRPSPPTEIGDPFVNLSSTYEVLFTVPREYSLVLSNVQKIREEGNQQVYHGIVERVRDLPIFLNRSYKEAVTTLGDVQIHYYFYSPSSRVQTVLETAKRALAYFQDNVGEYPWQQLNIVENDMYLEGMEYSTMVLVSTRALQNNPAGTVFHEVAHQWFYNIIGSDQINAPYMDEGLVQFFTAYALNGQEPRFHGDVYGLDKSVDEFTTWSRYQNVHYRNGQKLFENLYVVMGRDKFLQAIREYYRQYRFSLVSPLEFKHFFAEKTGDEGLLPAGRRN